MFHGTRSLLCARPSEVPAHAGKEPRPPGGGGLRAPCGSCLLLVPPRTGFATHPTPARHLLPSPSHTCGSLLLGLASQTPARLLPRRLWCLPECRPSRKVPCSPLLLRDPPWRRARTCGVSAYCFHVPAASPGAAPLQAADYTALFPTPAWRRRISSLKPATAGRC